AGALGSDRLRRSFGLAGDLPQPHFECHREGRAGRMGADGYRADQRRRRRHRRPPAASPCSVASRGLSLGPGRPSDSGKIRVWQRDEESGLQALAPRSWNRHRQVREGARALGEAHERNQPPELIKAEETNPKPEFRNPKQMPKQRNLKPRKSKTTESE